MKKTIIALLALSGIAFGTTETRVDGTITLDGSQPADTRLDFAYSTYAAQTVITTVDSVTIEGADGYGLNTEDTSVTLDVLGSLNATGNFKLATGSNASLAVKTTITDAELATLETDGTVGRYVLTADIISNISPLATGDKISLTLNGLTGVADGGLIYDYNGTYYSTSSVTLSGNYAAITTGAEAIELAKGTVYTTLKITGTSGASIKGIGFIATAPVSTPAVPEPTTATLSLLALAGLAARRRRK